MKVGDVIRCKKDFYDFHGNLRLKVNYFYRLNGINDDFYLVDHIIIPKGFYNIEDYFEL